MGNSLKKNVPVLRFPEFKGDLELKYLGEILDFKNGINADKSQYGQGVKFINVLDIINDAPIYYDSIIGCVDISDQEFQKNNVQYGDVLFQRSSEIREESGQSNIYLDKNQDATFGGFVIRGRPKVKFNPIYFNYLLKTGSVRKEVTDRSGGSTRFNIGQDSLNQVPILICNSIAEQEKIASFLGTVDIRISQLRRKYELLQTYKRGVMQKIFSQQIRFKGDDGKPFPDWEKKRLESIFSEFKSGYNITSDELTESGSYPVFGGNGIRGYSEKFTHEGFYFLIGRQGALCGNIHRSYGKAYISEHAIACKANDTSDTEWLAQRLDYYNLNKLSESSAQPGLAVNKLLRSKLLTPCKKEQEKIADFLTAIDKKIEAVAKQIQLTEQFKKGLLQKMFV